jgi:hypothetical protein
MLLSVDLSITEYVIESKITDQEFELLISTGEDSTIFADESNCEQLLSITREFGNFDLYDMLLDRFHGNFNISQPSKFLNLCSEISISFLSSQFYRLTSSDIDDIPRSALFHILSHDSLSISSEDSLYSYLCSRISVNPEYCDFLRFVRFEYVSRECFSDYISFHPIAGGLPLWNALSLRLLSRLSYVEIHCPLDERQRRARWNKPMNGILAYLTRKHGGNVHAEGIVTLTSNLNERDGNWLGNLVDGNFKSCFWTGEEPDQRVCLDFHTMHVRPTHYRLRAGLACYPNSWVVDGSLDGENWTEIHVRSAKDGDCPKFLPTNSVECRFIRITFTGPDPYWGSYADAFVAFEVFGTLLEFQE